MKLKLMRSMTLLAGSVLGISSASAMMGNVSSGAPPALCQIVVFDKDNKLDAICTGTLISTTEVATAAHCVNQMLFKSYKKRMEIRCGYEGVDEAALTVAKTVKGNDFYVSGVRFAETFGMAGVFIHPSSFFGGVPHIDLGLIVLDGESKLQPLPVVDESELVEAQARTVDKTPSFSSCMSSGLGVNREGIAGLPLSTRFDSIYFKDKAWQHFTGTQLPAPEVDFVLEAEKAENPTRAFTRYMTDKKYIASALEDGDSGGPLICRVGEQWKVVGVAAQHTLEYNTLGAIKLTSTWAPFVKSLISKRLR